MTCTLSLQHRGKPETFTEARSQGRLHLRAISCFNLFYFFFSSYFLRGARVAQWWEHSPATNVAQVQIPASNHMWAKFVVGSLPCSERFFSAYSGFPFSSKINISKFQFDQESGRRRITMWMFHLQIVIYLFIYIEVKIFLRDFNDT